MCNVRCAPNQGANEFTVRARIHEQGTAASELPAVHDDARLRVDTSGRTKSGRAASIQPKERPRDAAKARRGDCQPDGAPCAAATANDIPPPARLGRRRVACLRRATDQLSGRSQPPPSSSAQSRARDTSRRAPPGSVPPAPSRHHQTRVSARRKRCRARGPPRQQRAAARWRRRCPRRRRARRRW